MLFTSDLQLRATLYSLQDRRTVFLFFYVYIYINKLLKQRPVKIIGKISKVMPQP